MDVVPQMKRIDVAKMLDLWKQYGAIIDPSVYLEDWSGQSEYFEEGEEPAKPQIHACAVGIIALDHLKGDLNTVEYGASSATTLAAKEGYNYAYLDGMDSAFSSGEINLSDEDSEEYLLGAIDGLRLRAYLKQHGELE